MVPVLALYSVLPPPRPDQRYEKRRTAVTTAEEAFSMTEIGILAAGVVQSVLLFLVSFSVLLRKHFQWLILAFFRMTTAPWT